MYTALEHNRLYQIGLGPKARTIIYLYRDFPEDHPAVFNFQDSESGELVKFLLPQLTALEKEGEFEYLGPTLENRK